MHGFCLSFPSGESPSIYHHIWLLFLKIWLFKLGWGGRFKQTCVCMHTRVQAHNMHCRGYVVPGLSCSLVYRSVTSDWASPWWLYFTKQPSAPSCPHRGDDPASYMHMDTTTCTARTMRHHLMNNLSMQGHHLRTSWGRLECTWVHGHIKVTSENQALELNIPNQQRIQQPYWNQ